MMDPRMHVFLVIPVLLAVLVDDGANWILNVEGAPLELSATGNVLSVQNRTSKVIKEHRLACAKEKKNRILVVHEFASEPTPISALGGLVKASIDGSRERKECVLLKSKLVVLEVTFEQGDKWRLTVTRPKKPRETER